MVAYLIELGLGARRCPAEELDWHFDPLAALARLHTHFDNNPETRKPRNEEGGHTLDRAAWQLAGGTAAGVLKVAEAITAARLRAYYGRQQSGLWNGDIKAGEAGEAVKRAVEELRAVQGLNDFKLFAGQLHQETGPRQAEGLATSPILEPRDQPVVYPTKWELVEQLNAQLSS